MKTASMTYDISALTKEMTELSRKLIKGAETLAGIEEIDVGTAPKELVYEENKLKLYHYEQKGKVTCKVPVLIVYALVNRQYMLDLQPDRSIIRNLLGHGMDLYIIDWGYPTKADMYLTLDDYIDGYLNNCVDFVRKTSKNAKINLMGICQGGTFSAIYASLYPEKVKNLVTLVAPFDFSTNDALLFRWAKHMNGDSLADAFRVIPGDFLNAGFLMLMPFTLNIRKYVDLLAILEDKDKLLNFLRMEKWIFDSPGQAGECLRQFIKDCYQGNKLVKGELRVGDKVVNLRNVTMPLLNIYATADHLVPPAATKPLNDLVGTADKTLYDFKGGHIGVFVGSKSQKELAPAISQWLHERAGDEAAKKQILKNTKGAGQHEKKPNKLSERKTPR
jgi:polyhydroxyalkanoate synthase subunit PhaC